MFPPCFLTFIVVIDPYPHFKIIILIYSCTFNFYGLAIAIASHAVSENICSTKLHCYSIWEKIFIDVIITIYSHFSTTAEAYKCVNIQ